MGRADSVIPFIHGSGAIRAGRANPWDRCSPGNSSGPIRRSWPRVEAHGSVQPAGGEPTVGGLSGWLRDAPASNRTGPSSRLVVDAPVGCRTARASNCAGPELPAAAAHSRFVRVSTDLSRQIQQIHVSQIHVATNSTDSCLTFMRHIQFIHGTQIYVSTYSTEFMTHRFISRQIHVSTRNCAAPRFATQVSEYFHDV